jgi:hypothetical protein
LASEAEATELVALISAGTVKVFADVNPIKLVAAPTATIATETLTTKHSRDYSVRETSNRGAGGYSLDGHNYRYWTDDTTTDTGTATSRWRWIGWN